MDGPDVGFEDGMSWLPAFILHEACGNFHEEQLGRGVSNHHRHFYQHVNGTETNPLPPPQGKGGRKYNRGRKGTSNKASGGPGMQAIFLDPGHKSCGTGVFLPRRAGTQLQPPKKPACSAVLLPSRVVQALNIDVQSLGVQISPSQDLKNKKCQITNKVGYKKEDKDVVDHCYVISQDQSSSTEICLPKEWSY